MRAVLTYLLVFVSQVLLLPRTEPRRGSRPSKLRLQNGPEYFSSGWRRLRIAGRMVVVSVQEALKLLVHLVSYYCNVARIAHKMAGFESA